MTFKDIIFLNIVKTLIIKDIKIFVYLMIKYLLSNDIVTICMYTLTVYIHHSDLKSFYTCEI